MNGADEVMEWEVGDLMLNFRNRKHIKMKLESYGCCCKMKVTTAVSILGWIGIIISSLFIIGGILLAVEVIPQMVSSNSLNLIIPSVLIIIVSFLSLLINLIMIKRNRASSFGAVKSLIQIICKIFLALELIYSLTLFISKLTLLTLRAVNYPIGSIEVVVTKVLNFVDPSAALTSVNTDGSLQSIVFSSAAIYGIRKNSKELLNTYIIFNIIQLVGPIALVILSIFTDTAAIPVILAKTPVEEGLPRTYSILNQ